jgi:NAD dependent epimerase/dehydratase family enzyme
LNDTMRHMQTPPLRIVLPGGSGQVGIIIARHFHAQGHDVIVLARNAKRAPWRTVPWDGATLGRWTDELEKADLVINLAGRSVNCRYNEFNRREIKESRVRTTRLVGEAISRLAHPPRNLDECQYGDYLSRCLRPADG